ncbi:hypothetical protein G9A89_013082 [Geosiphon pyriformis]|nr:hypothetical protein G9A89_013082 [Geosiphon pyriformis]
MTKKLESIFNIGVKSAESRKKRRGGVLEDNIGNKKFAAAKVSSGHSWGSETGDTIESDSVDMEEECLVEETSFDYRDGGAFAGEKSEQMPKSLKILTKRAFGKPLRKIDFLDNNIDDILLDKPVVLPLSLKNLVNVSVRKFFVLNISLDNVIRKSAQKKLVVVRKLFSKINGFGGAFTPSKFAGIIRVMFTFESSLAQASKKAEEIMVLKEIFVGTSTKTVCAALSDFGVVKALVEFSKSEQTDLVMACWSVLIGKNAALLYTLPIDYVSSVSGKTCVIGHYPVIYAWARCAVVCFESADSLNAVMRTTPVLRSVNMCWSFLGFSKCTECGKLGHISLGCAKGENPSSGEHSRRPLSDMNKSRLATIYAKHLALIACPVAFGGVSWAKIAGKNVFPPFPVHEVLVNSGSFLEMKPTLLNINNIEKRFAVLESSLVSLTEQIGKLAKRLDSFMLADQVGNVVMGKGLGNATSGKTATILDSSASPEVKRLENMLEELSALVLSLTARFDGSILAGSASFKPPSQ